MLKKHLAKEFYNLTSSQFPLISETYRLEESYVKIWSHAKTRILMVIRFSDKWPRDCSGICHPSKCIKKNILVGKILFRGQKGTYLKTQNALSLLTILPIQVTPYSDQKGGLE